MVSQHRPTNMLSLCWVFLSNLFNKSSFLKYRLHVPPGFKARHAALSESLAWGCYLSTCSDTVMWRQMIEREVWSQLLQSGEKEKWTSTCKKCWKTLPRFSTKESGKVKPASGSLFLCLHSPVFQAFCSFLTLHTPECFRLSELWCQEHIFLMGLLTASLDLEIILWVGQDISVILLNSFHDMPECVST